MESVVWVFGSNELQVVAGTWLGREENELIDLKCRAEGVSAVVVCNWSVKLKLK